MWSILYFSVARLCIRAPISRWLKKILMSESPFTLDILELGIQNHIEKMLEFYSSISKMKTTAIRHSNIYGPYDKLTLRGVMFLGLQFQGHVG